MLRLVVGHRRIDDVMPIDVFLVLGSWFFVSRSLYQKPTTKN
jgi:hypothetical protein